MSGADPIAGPIYARASEETVMLIERITKDHGPISILLHANKGFLVEMEVIGYDFPEPFPASWVS